MRPARPNAQKILDAVGGAPPKALTEALLAAARAGKTSSVETLLGALSTRLPQDSPAAAEDALAAAVSARHWGTVVYLADYLSETAPHHRATADGGATNGPGFEEELLRSLHDHEGAVGRGAAFSLSEAIVRSGPDPTARPDPAKAGGCMAGPVRFAHVEPGMPEGAYGSAADPSPYFNLGAPEKSLQTLQNANEVVIPTRTARALFDFPAPLGRKPRMLTLEAPGGHSHFTRASLGRAVAARYQELADESREAWSDDLSDLDLVEVVPRSEGLYGLRVVA